MAATATVTAKVADLSANYRPDWQPIVLVALDKPSVTLDGTAVNTEPIIMEDDGNGNISADLIVSTEFATRTHYTMTIDWLSLSGETALRERLPNIIVPPEGGDIGSLGLVETGLGLAWEGSTPPHQSMLWLYMDEFYDPDSGDPLPTYKTDDGEIIEHGELVEWSTE